MLALSLPDRSFATPVPDPTLGLNGMTRVVSPLLVSPTAVIGLFDGRVVVAGTTPTNAITQSTIVRLTANGLPDTTFGTQSQTTLPDFTYCNQGPRLIRRPDDSVVVATAGGTDVLCKDGAVFGGRILFDGSRDTTFRISGLPPTGGPLPLTLAQDSGGNIYVAGAGEVHQAGFTYLARLALHGALDIGFGDNGLVLLQTGATGVDRAAGVAPLNDGTTLTASLTGTVLLLSHFSFSGSPLPATNGTPTFPISLQLATPNSDRLRLINFFRLADGANLVILKREGPSSNGLIIVRTADNVSSYGISQLIISATTTDWPAAAALSDGTVVIAEVTGSTGNRQVSLRRMFANSSFDPTWGTGRAYVLGTGINVTAMAEDFAGRLVFAGTDAAGAMVGRLRLNAEPFYASAVALEFHNSILDHYFITADQHEADLIGQGSAGPGWSATSYGIRVHTDALGVPAGAVRVCRFYGNRAINPATGQPYGPNSHVYVLDGPECDAVRGDPGWVFENFAFYLFPAVNGQCAIGRDPVYRAYNNRAAQNDSNHRFVTSQNIYQQMLAAGWRGEGVVMCAPQ